MDLEGAGHLVPGKALPAERSEVGPQRVGPDVSVAQGERRMHGLTHLLVGDAEHGGIGHCPMVGEDGLDLGG